MPNSLRNATNAFEAQLYRQGLQPEKIPMSRYIIVADLPACSAVLFVNGKEVTILAEGSRETCRAYAVGYRAGSGIAPAVEHRGSIKLPAGNPALSFSDRILGGAV